MGPLKLALLALVAFIAFTVTLACAPPHPADPASAPAPVPAGGCYLVQLHLHGHSNHNGNPLPASMDSHSAEADRNGFDAIWWTDHADLYDDFRDLVIDFAQATEDTGGEIRLTGARLGRQLSSVECQTSLGGKVSLADGRLILEAGKGDSALFRGSAAHSTARISPASRLGKVHTVNFCRPVTSGLKLDVWLAADGLGPDTYLRVGFDLSWHPDGQHHVIFETGGSDASGREGGDTTVFLDFEVPAPGPGVAGSRVTFDLEQAASYLPRGDDNTLSSFYIEVGELGEVGARGPRPIRVAIDSLILRSDKTEGSNQVDAVRSLALRYRDVYSIPEYVGVEIGKMHTPGLPHMNAYYPDDSSRTALDIETRGSRQSWVERVHGKGGIVSFNHPFGANRNPRNRKGPAGESAEGDGESYEDVPTAIAPRILAARGPAVTEDEFWEVAEPLLANRGLGADMLEVGYLFRGIGSLDDHLRLWDLALANGIRLVGTGTSDSHGGVWGPDMIPNPFASWIWAASPGAADLIAAIRRGRVAFGDPFFWKSSLAFQVEGDAGKMASIGDTLTFAGGHASATGRIRIVPARDDIEIRFVTVRIKPAREVEKAVAVLSPDDALEGFEFGFDTPSYVRVEIYAKDGTPLVFTNPIFLLGRN